MDGMIADENVVCQFEGQECDHEGYVQTNRYGTFKLVDRRAFSYRNFTTKKWLDKNNNNIPDGGQLIKVSTRRAGSSVACILRESRVHS